MKPKKSEEIVVKEKKLGREKAKGQMFPGKNVIEIDPRQSNVEYMDTLIHEGLHIIFPDLSEKEVIKSSKKLSKVLWKAGYRKVNL